MKRTIYLLLAVAMMPLTYSQAQQLSSDQVKFFEGKIRPALVKYCYECHSVEAGDSRGGLLVDTRDGLRNGGGSGPAIVPHDLDDGTFWEAITWDGLEMPPSKQMPDDVIADFKKWIEMGAPDPRVREILEFKTKITAENIREAQKKHWSFQPPKAKSGSSIDSIVNAKLKEAELEPSKPADTFTLLRRMNFDLVGLPPTPDEIKAFCKAYKSDPDKAVEKKITELLKRPQFGERWGRHWMDVARYAESSGSRNVSYPHAWRYRDYVIDSFNDDTPYDQFIEEQIAGDLLPVKSDRQWNENLIATGFLAIGLKHHDEKNPRKFESDMVDEQIDAVTQSVLGLTVACARCHDHKFDPIPTADYYALAGIFKSTKTYFGTQRIAQNHRTSDLLLLPIADKGAEASGQSSSITSLKKKIAELDQQMVQARKGRKEDGGPNKEFKRLRNIRNRLAGELASFDASGTKKTYGMGVQDANQMVNANILISGEIDQPAQEVDRGFLQVLGNLNFQETSSRSSGRKQLAESMTSKNNPLTARVMVNRIWMHLLGRPIVGTPNNFGFSGMEPDNQELLDYLAVKFMKKGWSVKTMIREIMMSDAYQRSSDYIEANYLADPDNKLSWRSNPRQLDAESLRDAMLALAGSLDLKRPYGSAVAESGGGKTGQVQINADATYRSVYLPIIRDEVIEPLALFDFADPNSTSASRQESIVPTQALYMMNGEFAIKQATSMAAALEKSFDSTNDQVRNAFLWVYGRPPTDAEIKASAQFFKEFKSTGQLTFNASTNSQQNQRGKRGQKAESRQVKGNKGSRRGRGGNSTSSSSSSTASKSDSGVSSGQRLAVFCQTLMASARFRILN